MSREKDGHNKKRDEEFQEQLRNFLKNQMEILGLETWYPKSKLTGLD